MKMIPGYQTANMPDEFVVFLIGMRINHFWKISKWWPPITAMPRMLNELKANPELGFLHEQSWMSYRLLMTVQYWRSVEDLFNYAASKDNEHLPAWKAFNKAVGDTGDVGIWHETYVVRQGQYEVLYGNMPPFGLGAVGSLEPAKGHFARAKGRMTGQATDEA